MDGLSDWEIETIKKNHLFYVFGLPLEYKRSMQRLVDMGFFSENSSLYGSVYYSLTDLGKSVRTLIDA